MPADPPHQKAHLWASRAASSSFTHHQRPVAAEAAIMEANMTAGPATAAAPPWPDRKLAPTPATRATTTTTIAEIAKRAGPDMDGRFPSPFMESTPVDMTSVFYSSHIRCQASL